MDKAQSIVNNLNNTFQGITTELSDYGDVLRIYGNTYPIKDTLKSDFSARWSPDLRCWWIDLVDADFLKNKLAEQQSRLAKDFTGTDKSEIVKLVNEKVYAHRSRTWDDNLPLHAEFRNVVTSNPDITFSEVVDMLIEKTLERETTLPENTETEPAYRKLITLPLTHADDYSTQFLPCYLVYTKHISDDVEYRYISTEKLRKNSTYHAIVEQPYQYLERTKIIEIVSKSSSKSKRIVEDWKSQGYTDEYTEFIDIIRTPAKCLSTIKH